MRLGQQQAASASQSIRHGATPQMPSDFFPQRVANVTGSVASLAAQLATLQHAQKSRALEAHLASSAGDLSAASAVAATSSSSAAMNMRDLSCAPHARTSASGQQENESRASSGIHTSRVSSGALPPKAQSDPAVARSATSETDPTPRSRQVRQGQVRQGDAEGVHHRSVGRSRTVPSVATKATTWRSERESLRISINKVQSLHEAPASPKLVKRPKVWGAKPFAHSTLPETYENRSAGAIKERIEKKLARMFGSSQADRPKSLQERKNAFRTV